MKRATTRNCASCNNENFLVVALSHHQRFQRFFFMNVKKERERRRKEHKGYLLGVREEKTKNDKREKSRASTLCFPLLTSSYAVENSFFATKKSNSHRTRATKKKTIFHSFSFVGFSVSRLPQRAGLFKRKKYEKKICEHL